MPIPHYGVLKGRPIGSLDGAGRDPHYQIRVIDQTTDYRVAVNIKSQESPSDLEYLIDEDFSHAITDGVAELAAGFHPLQSRPGGLALDFIRSNLFHRDQMTKLPFGVATPDQLDHQIDDWVQRAIADERAMIYAFGQRWGPEQNKKDQYFGFLPGNGVHDIHMNQGNDGHFVQDDGVYQDGALMLQFPDDRSPSGSRWVAVFLKFQSQPWHTDDRTGHAIAAPVEQPPPLVGALPAAPPPEAGPAPAEPTLGPGEQDFLVRIVAATVKAADGQPETVTLLNTAPRAIDLKGWAIANTAKDKAPLSGTITPGGAKLVSLPPSVRLSNKGGIITLLDQRGLKVDGVAYTKSQAKRHGWTIVF